MAPNRDWAVMEPNSDWRSKMHSFDEDDCQESLSCWPTLCQRNTPEILRDEVVDCAKTWIFYWNPPLDFEFCVHLRNNSISKEQRVFLQEVSAEEEESDFDDEEESDAEDADPNAEAEEWGLVFLYQAAFAEERCCSIIWSFLTWTEKDLLFCRSVHVNSYSIAVPLLTPHLYLSRSYTLVLGCVAWWFEEINCWREHSAFLTIHSPTKDST